MFPRHFWTKLHIGLWNFLEFQQIYFSRFVILFISLCASSPFEWYGPNVLFSLSDWLCSEIWQCPIYLSWKNPHHQFMLHILTSCILYLLFEQGLWYSSGSLKMRSSKSRELVENIVSYLHKKWYENLQKNGTLLNAGQNL